MTVNPLDGQNTNVPTGPFILACGFCNWTTLDIGMEFDKMTNIYGQIALKHGGFPNTLSPTRRPLNSDQLSDSYPRSGPDAIFASLKSFYSSQLSASKPTNSLLTPSGEFNYNSPSSLARIMSLYTGLGTQDKKSPPKPQVMRESANKSEGLCITDPNSDAKAIQKLREQGWAGTTSTTQRNSQPQSPRFLTDILPIPTLLRTKRNKRCRTCRHLLVLPESKVQSTRFRLRQVAFNFIPTMTLKHLSPTGGQSQENQSHGLSPLEPTQFLLTLKNPLYEAIRITLATPPHTPGPHAHRVTILCPQFDVGRNTDLWDDALHGGGKGDDTERAGGARPRPRPSGPSKAHESILGGDGNKVAEAGKVWDQGRNWTTVVLEVIGAPPVAVVGGGDDERARGTEDELVVEIPVFVRVDWHAHALKDEAAAPDKGRERRELAYWAVIGVGTVGAGGRQGGGS